MKVDQAQPFLDLVPAPRPCPGLRSAARTLLLVGVLLSAASLMGDTNRVRLEFAYLWAFSFGWTLALGALFFVGLQHLVRGAWSVVIRRVAEMFASFTSLAALLFVPLLVLCWTQGGSALYPWLDVDHVAHDAILQGKQPYLNVTFFSIRALAFFAVWVIFAGIFVNTSIRQDDGIGGVSASLRLRRRSAPFMLLFGVTMTFASFDWLMSLEPHWFSTIFGVYVFSGMVVAALSAIILTTIALRRAGRLGHGVVGDGHLYNLGALLFGFVCFWGYIAFSQYMLIWYGNIPEETFYLIHRLEGGWLPVSVLLGVVRFVVPFLLLLSRPAKTDARRLVIVSVLMLLGQFIDLYWLIMPQLHKDAPVLGWQELGPPLIVLGLLLLFVAGFLKDHRPVPVGDPLLEESMQSYL